MYIDVTLDMWIWDKTGKWKANESWLYISIDFHQQVVNLEDNVGHEKSSDFCLEAAPF